MKVILSPKAREYVTSEARYLKSKSTRAGQQFADELKRLRHELGLFPHMGKTTPELPFPNAFRFVLGAYLVDYEIRAAQIFILAIRHGRERPPGVAVEDDFDLEEADDKPDSAS